MGWRKLSEGTRRASRGAGVFGGDRAAKARVLFLEVLDGGGPAIHAPCNIIDGPPPRLAQCLLVAAGCVGSPRSGRGCAVHRGFAVVGVIRDSEAHSCCVVLFWVPWIEQR